MSKPVKRHQFIKAPHLTPREQHEINCKIEFATAKSLLSLVKLIVFSNIISALLYVVALYNSTEHRLLIAWFSILFTANLLNVFWEVRFEYNTRNHEDILKCRTGFFYILILICLIWSSIGILFISAGTHQQITTIIFLSVVLICFSFFTAIDLTISIASIVCLLLPTIGYHFYLTHFFNTGYTANHLNMSITAALLVLGLFMSIVCVVGNKIILKIFRLGYENTLLGQKLKNMNTVLEQRVKARTKELEKPLKLVTYQATHDLLTDLPNERLLYKSIYTATEQAIKNHNKFAIACFSLNSMVKVTNSIGHQASSTIIHRVAQRFAQLAARNNKFFISLSRQDVFAILINPIWDTCEIDGYAQELLAVLQDPIYVAKQELTLTGSIGISIFPSDGRDVDRLITNAESARVLATKNGGDSVRIYNRMFNADAARQLNIENQLYHAIENNELALYYQPFIDLRSGSVCGAEALIRWKNPELGLIPPMDFIPIAETNGMILPIGEWVLSNACQQLKKWHNNGFKSLIMSVNLSAKQLVQHNLVERIEEILRNLRLDPHFLELELTESNAFQNDSIPIINQFTEMGISLAIDDFGTGYSEFGNLKLFKVDKIKIDQTFIQDININIDSKNIVCNTISLAHRMNIKCLAEGIETLEQVNFLKENGCYMMQGYYFSEPLNAHDFFEFLKNHSKKSTTTQAKKHT